MSENDNGKTMRLLSSFMWLGSTIVLLSCEDETYFEVRHDGPRLDVAPSVKFDELWKADELYHKYLQRLIQQCSHSELWNYMQHKAQVYTDTQATSANKHLGSSLESLLKEEGVFEHVEAEVSK